MENLNQPLFISTSIVKYKALAWPPTWHPQHRRETKKSQFIATKWNRFESYKLTQKIHHKARHGKKKCVSQVRVERLVLVSGKWWEDCPAAAFCAAEGKKYKVERKRRFVAFVNFFLSPLVASVHFLQFCSVVCVCSWRGEKVWLLKGEQGMQRAGKLLWHRGEPNWPQWQSSAIWDCPHLEYLFHLTLGPTSRTVSAPECKGMKRHIPKIKIHVQISQKIGWFRQTQPVHWLLRGFWRKLGLLYHHKRMKNNVSQDWGFFDRAYSLQFFFGEEILRFWGVVCFAVLTPPLSLPPQFFIDVKRNEDFSF